MVSSREQVRAGAKLGDAHTTNYFRRHKRCYGSSDSCITCGGGGARGFPKFRQKNKNGYTIIGENGHCRFLSSSFENSVGCKGENIVAGGEAAQECKLATMFGS